MAKIKIKCDTCKIEFEKYESKLGKNNFCCRQCYNVFHSKDVKKYICEICNKEFKGAKHNANRFCSRECYNKFHNIKNKQRICPTCGKEFEARTSEDKYCSQKCHLENLHKTFKGDNHWNWKGGISKENDNRDSNEYKKWRQEVYKRDDYKCKKCKSKEKINAHHILSWNHYPEFRYEVSNGITLCAKCHIKIHQQYGYDSKERMI